MTCQTTKRDDLCCAHTIHGLGDHSAATALASNVRARRDPGGLSHLVLCDSHLARGRALLQRDSGSSVATRAGLSTAASRARPASRRVAHIADALALWLVGRAASCSQPASTAIRYAASSATSAISTFGGRSVAPGRMHAAVEFPWARA